MSKKDYELIAAALKSAYPKESTFTSTRNVNGAIAEFRDTPKYKTALDTWASVLAAISYKLADQNPSFKRERFYSACIPPEV